jgi:hypothetical protein
MNPSSSMTKPEPVEEPWLPWPKGSNGEALRWTV